MAPRISVVFATHNRARRLDMLLDSLAQQTLPADQFEVIVVDDGSSDATTAVLGMRASQTPFSLKSIRLDPGRGPAMARNAGWREATGELVAFTDDDCVATPGWLEAGWAAYERDRWSVIQGRVDLNPAELDQMSPFVHFFFHNTPGGGYPTANIFYPRALLEDLGGFDAETFPTVDGEDTDLALRAFGLGARSSWVPEAQVLHGVLRVGAIHRVKVGLRWTPLVQLFKLHPELRRELRFGLFWRENHWLLTRFLIALALPRRLGPVRIALAAPYVKHLTDRRTGPLLAPYLLAIDLVEVGAIVRGAIRYRVPLI